MWKRLNHGYVKLNVDASFQSETLSDSTGAVALDDKGNFIVAAFWFITQMNNVDSAEMSAIRNGIILATNIRCSKVIVDPRVVSLR